MNFLRRQCPNCKFMLEMTPFKIRTHCQCCGSVLELRPDFLSTFSGKVLFFSVAMLLGNTLSDLLSVMDFPEDELVRVFIDLVASAVYYAICRVLFSCFQHPKVIAPGNEEIAHGNE